MISGAKFGMPVTLNVAALGQRVADAERAVIGDADDVAGHRLLGQFAVVAEEEHRVGDGELLAGPDVAAASCRA